MQAVACVTYMLRYVSYIRERLDLQAALRKLLPLLGAYVVLAHYVACAYWAIVMSEVKTANVRRHRNARATVPATVPR